MTGAKYPKFENILCNGYNLENEKYLSKINLRWLILAYKKEKNKETFFRSGFHRLAGNKELENQIKSFKEENKSLKIANNLLGSNEGKTQTKAKINSLIKEVDYCISQLTEMN